MALQASYTREAEAEADLASVELLRRAGIRAGTFPQLLLRLERKYGMGGSDDEAESGEEESNNAPTDDNSFSIPDILASHPATPDRAATVAAAAGTGGGPSMSDEDWQALRTICSRR
jgi:predicted Zn-dependent protease